MDLGKIKFIQEYEHGSKIVHEIRGDSSLDDVIEAFEMFLRGAGYHLNAGQHIGYEYDEAEEFFDRGKELARSIDNGTFGVDEEGSMYTDYPFADSGVEEMGHSKYYYDKDRNR